VNEVERFVYAEYLPALTKGHVISAEEKRAVATRLALHRHERRLLGEGRLARESPAVPAELKRDSA